MPNPFLEAALKYAGRGWRVLPLKPRDKRPHISRWPEQATTKPTVIRKWWRQWPKANVGIATGAASRLIVLDLDRKENIDGPKVAEALWGWEPPEVAQKTGGGGVQAFYAWDEKHPLKNKARLGGHDGIDVRGEGGYVVVPPSVHPNGQPYFWLGDDSAELEPLPTWLISLCEGSKERPKAPQQDGPITEGERNTTLARIAGALRRHGLSESSILAALLEENKKRCNPPLDEKEVRQIAHSISRYPPVTSEHAKVALREDANPPFDLFMALRENNRKFKTTWERQRADFTSDIQYDSALAAFAAAVGWSPQQIADLIVAHRRKHGSSTPDAEYLGRIIARAINEHKKERDLLELETTAPQTGDSKDAVLHKLKQYLGLDIKAWQQHGRENARFSLVLAVGTVIRIGTTENVLSPRYFRSRIYEATQKLLPTMKQAAWDGICRLLASIVETVENEEMTNTHVMADYISSYLESHPAVDDDTWQEAFRLGEPFIRKGELHISAQALRRFLRTQLGERGLSHPELCELLRLLGYSRQTVMARLEGKPASKSYWRKKHKKA